MAGENGLLPTWEADTLIIGTFNPCNDWVINNQANYFYGRSQYFWKAIPQFACYDEIDNLDVVAQFDFLKKNRIALTDLLISINDVDVENEDHRNWIGSYLDNELNNFPDITWNTSNIIEYIIRNKIKAVYFTRLGNNAPFGEQITIIENYCNVNGLINFRLHTPTGLGLGAGAPRRNKLIHRWYEQGGNQFPFLCPDFDINDPEFVWHL
ncbi:hypothetical protein [Mucilaginibacter sp.]|uniref:hypothetical protein n=1 Tax=Mucilaginibacter sp. TaxID=1882438 RepID=UPI0025EF9D76|nr:hypothetical protein [Mucilaginibacter sp.]